MGAPVLPPLLLLPALGISPWGTEQRVQERSPCPCVVCWLCTEPLSAALQEPGLQAQPSAWACIARALFPGDQPGGVPQLRPVLCLQECCARSQRGRSLPVRSERRKSLSKARSLHPERLQPLTG